MVLENLVKQGTCRAKSGNIYYKRYKSLLVLLVALIAGCSGSGTGDSNTSSRTTGVVDVKANAGIIVPVRVGETAFLDGSGSSAPAGRSLSYAWKMESKPDGSNAQLQNPTSANPSFTADKKGVYFVELIVTAGGTSSERTVGIVVATKAPENATGPHSHINLSSNCYNCHNGTDVTSGPKSGDHMASTNLCQSCHSPLGFALIAYVDHKEVFGNCSDCHDGVTAMGKSNNHIPTEEECSDCHHNTESFLILELGGTFDHTGITRGCDGCHDGVLAIGKDAKQDPPHMDTVSDCYVCHSTEAFTPAINVNHDNIVDNCAQSGCHGDGATGKALNHPLTSDNCEVCHSYPTFVISPPFNHDDLDNEVNSCETCHDGTHTAAGARGKTTVASGHPDTTSDCGNCHNTEDFAQFFVDHTGPDVVGKRCDDCHNGTTATGLPLPYHMPLQPLQDCSDCHTPGNFATGVFDHDPTVVDPVRCDSCHDDTISVGKGVTHLPTTEDCRVCHSTTSFTDATVDHTNIFSGCIDCHDGEISTGKIDAVPDHIPANDNCNECHTTIPLAFSPSIYAHLGVSNNCESCHNGVFTKVVDNKEIILGKHDIHIPTLDDCVTCHTIGTSFAGATYDHTGLTEGCKGCHSGLLTTPGGTILGKPHIYDPDRPNDVTHLPTEQDCYLCHTPDPAVPWADSGKAVFAHTEITGNCESCHNGLYLDKGNTGALDKASAANHPVTTEDCGACHNTTDFANYFVDHSGIVNNCTNAGCHDLTTTEGQYAVSPAHTSPTNGNDCEECHVAGGTWTAAVFDHSTLGPNDRCDSCHNGTNATGMSQNHIPIQNNQDCSDCHNTTAFAGAAFDHTGINGNCVSCHNGTQATGKHNDHVPTNDDCVNCHNTAGFLPSTFDHVGIVDNCESCHNGIFATGKDADHLSTTEDCAACHTASDIPPNGVSFLNAFVDHSGIVNNCGASGCHDPSTTEGQHAASANHVPSNGNDCEQCHVAGGSWLNATFDHSTLGPGDNCSDCHNGTTATGKSGGHFRTTAECDACHVTTGWAPVDYTHSPNGDYPGDHRINLGCTRCHTDNDQTISYPFNYPGTCAGCHANDFDAGEHNGGLNNNLNCGNSGCHRVSDRGW